MNSFILSNKVVPDLKKFHMAIKEAVSVFDGILKDENQCTIILTVPVTQQLIDQIEAIVPPPALTQQEYVQKTILDAVLFGTNLITEFTTQNVMLGIMQDNMSNTVRKNMAEIVSALNIGSLYDAIEETKALPEDKKDSKYLTNTRLLYFINKIEEYLELELSISL